MNSKTTSTKWLITTAIALMAAGAGAYAWFELIPKITGEAENEHIGLIYEEMDFRLQEIRGLLYKDEVTNRDLYAATMRVEAHGVGISQEFKDIQLRSLLFELEQLETAENREKLKDIRNLFEELAEVAPQAPFVDGDLADLQRVQLAREKFGQIESEFEYLKDNRYA